MAVSNVIFGFEGQELSHNERSFFKDVNPYGYILFTRNIDNPTQLKKLTDELRELASEERLPILIDQEGGRVARMKPPHWPQFPSARDLVQQGCGDSEATKDLVYNNALKLGETLKQVGINVNCAPVLDIPVDGSDPIISDRAFGTIPAQVVRYAEAMIEGLMDAGVLPVIKHIPGHGRATVDSHIALPKVDTPLSLLSDTDFQPFKSLNQAPYAMTAHIVYSALDKGACATFSSKVIQYIREEIGYEGLLMTDDLSMQALTGSYAKRTKQAIDAGCDLVLHCNGNMKEMVEIASETKIIDQRIAELTSKAFYKMEQKAKQVA